jgi:hypothetical protein
MLPKYLRCQAACSPKTNVTFRCSNPLLQTRFLRRSKGQRTGPLCTWSSPSYDRVVNPKLRANVAVIGSEQQVPTTRPKAAIVLLDECTSLRARLGAELISSTNVTKKPLRGSVAALTGIDSATRSPSRCIVNPHTLPNCTSIL